MNKFLARTLTVTLLLMMVCTTAFAAVDMSAVKGTDGKITVTVTGLTDGEESTLLAVVKDTALSTVADNTDKICYIDQMTVADGTATYTFDAGSVKNIDIYSGYTSMPADSAPLKEVVEEEVIQPDNPPAADFIYGDVDGNKTVDLMDASEVISYYFDSSVEFSDKVNGLKAGDVDGSGSVDLMDASEIISYYFDSTVIFTVNKPADAQ